MNITTEKDHIKMLLTTFCQFTIEKDQNLPHPARGNNKTPFITIEHDDISSATENPSSRYNDPNSSLKAPISWGY